MRGPTGAVTAAPASSVRPNALNPRGNWGRIPQFKQALLRKGQLLMTRAERDRLETLKKAKKKLITQREAAAAPKLGIGAKPKGAQARLTECSYAYILALWELD